MKSFRLTIGLNVFLAAANFGLAAESDVSPRSPSAEMDEFTVKREAVFEFAQKPVVTREGDQVTVAFESKGFCDVTVAIEAGEGRIVRHLVSGVLGPKAPEPLQKDSKKQVVAWDGKDDRGIYVDDKGNCTVRVSLGLKPQFERTLYWSPHKRISSPAPLLAAAPEGVYVVEGTGVDHLRLFDHAGEYVRTVYPFPADKVGQVVGLQMHAFPQDGQALPQKVGYERATLLTSGSSGAFQEGGHAGGSPATAMAVWQDRIALAYQSLNRLSTNGTSGSLPIKGPKVSFVRPLGKRREVVGPTSIAFSPDGRRLYLTGYVWKQGLYNRDSQCFHVVQVLDYEKQEEPTVFLGVEKTDDGYGAGNDRFCVPLSVDCDGQGRVYVADYGNSRIQVFSPEGRHLKTLAVPLPATVKVDRATGEIWVFSGMALGVSPAVETAMKIPEKLKPSVCRLGTFEQPVKAEPEPLPMVEGTGRGGWDGTGG